MGFSPNVIAPRSSYTATIARRSASENRRHAITGWRSQQNTSPIEDRRHNATSTAKPRLPPSANEPDSAWSLNKRSKVLQRGLQPCLVVLRTNPGRDVLAADGDASPFRNRLKTPDDAHLARELRVIALERPRLHDAFIRNEFEKPAFHFVSVLRGLAPRRSRLVIGQPQAIAAALTKIERQ